MIYLHIDLFENLSCNGCVSPGDYRTELVVLSGLNKTHTAGFQTFQANSKRRQLFSLFFFCRRGSGQTAKQVMIIRLPSLTLVHWKREITYVLKGIETIDGTMQIDHPSNSAILKFEGEPSHK